MWPNTGFMASPVFLPHLRSHRPLSSSSATKNLTSPTYVHSGALPMSIYRRINGRPSPPMRLSVSLSDIHRTIRGGPFGTPPCKRSSSLTAPFSGNLFSLSTRLVYAGCVPLLIRLYLMIVGCVPPLVHLHLVVSLPSSPHQYHPTDLSNLILYLYHHP